MRMTSAVESAVADYVAGTPVAIIWRRWRIDSQYIYAELKRRGVRLRVPARARPLKRRLRDTAVAAYLAGEPVLQIEERLGISGTTIYRALREAGKPLRTTKARPRLCDWCGAPMTGRSKYCAPQCRAEASEDRHRREGAIANCQHCKREMPGWKVAFCGKECREQARQKKWAAELKEFARLRRAGGEVKDIKVLMGVSGNRATRLHRAFKEAQ